MSCRSQKGKLFHEEASESTLMFEDRNVVIQTNYVQRKNLSRESNMESLSEGSFRAPNHEDGWDACLIGERSIQTQVVLEYIAITEQ